MKYSIFTIVFFIFCSNVYAAADIQLIESQHGMQDEVLKFIPVGSSLKKGVSLLEKAGFKCHNSGRKLYTGEKASTYTTCFYRVSPSQPEEKFWLVIMVHRDDLIEYLEVKYEGAG